MSTIPVMIRGMGATPRRLDMPVAQAITLVAELNGEPRAHALARINKKRQLKGLPPLA